MRRSLLLVLTVVLGYPAPSSGALSYHEVPAARLAARMAAGKPVAHNRAVIRGPLTIPAVVRAPVELSNCVFRGRILARHTLFEGLVDLTGSTLRQGIDARNAHFADDFLFQSARSLGRVRLSLATFERVANFSHARFESRVSFERATFQRDARFPGAQFERKVTYRLASFDGTADFQIALFGRTASFGQAQFEADADFSSAEFGRNADFKGARFARETDFVATQFTTRGDAWATFEEARFATGANFFGVPFPQVTTFHSSRAGGDMNFEHGSFSGRADFAATRYADRVNFKRADFREDLNLEDAFVETLDLSDSAPNAVWLPTSEQIGNVGGLMMDLDVVPRVAGDDEAQRRISQVRALNLIEETAKGSDDLSTANAARVRRLELERDERPFVRRTLDWIFWWGFLGYWVQPIHQLIVIAVLLALGIAVRILSRPADDRQADDQLEDAFRGLLRLVPPADRWRLLEYVAFKATFAVLLVNLGNVWPPFRDLVDGVL